MSRDARRHMPYCNPIHRDRSRGRRATCGKRHARSQLVTARCAQDLHRACSRRAVCRAGEGGYTAASQYEIKYTYANGVEHTCKTTTADNFFGGKARDTEPGERRNGILFEGADGWIFVSRGVAEASKPEILKDPLPSDAKRLYHLIGDKDYAKLDGSTRFEMPGYGYRWMRVGGLR